MRELTIDEMAEIRGGGWNTEEFLCNLAFDQLAGWNSLAIGMAIGGPAGAFTAFGVGLALGVGGNAICALITS